MSPCSLGNGFTNCFEKKKPKIVISFGQGTLTEGGR
jgi:hypothetical protein